MSMKDAEIEQLEGIAKEVSKTGKNLPFDAGIKEFKRELLKTALSKSDRNKAVKQYKERVYSKVEEIKEKISERRAKEA